jgi:hypothetical protein
VPGLIHATAASGWSLGGSMLTFAFPMGLFIVAATTLYLVFTRPHRVPGHRELAVARPVPSSHTAAAAATADGDAPQPADQGTGEQEPGAAE